MYGTNFWLFRRAVAPVGCDRNTYRSEQSRTRARVRQHVSLLRSRSAVQFLFGQDNGGRRKYLQPKRYNTLLALPRGKSEAALRFGAWPGQSRARMGQRGKGNKRLKTLTSKGFKINRSRTQFGQSQVSVERFYNLS